MRRFVISALISLVVAGCSTADGTPTGKGANSSLPTHSSTPEISCDEPCYGDPEVVGSVRRGVASSISGVAASVRNPGAYYVVSDEEGTSSVAAVRTDGKPLAEFAVEGMVARNAEALAVGRCDDESNESCLYIGDIGNHVGLEDLFIYRVREPDLARSPDVVAADVWRYTYPEEPTDAEALIVSGAGVPIVISKAVVDDDTGDSGATQVFRGAIGGGSLEKVGAFKLPEPKTGMLAEFVGNVVTGADVAPGRVVLRTYDEVLEYRSDERDAHPARFFEWEMHRVPAPNQLQSEAVTYHVDKCGYLTAAELDGGLAAVACRQ